MGEQYFKGEHARGHMAGDGYLAATGKFAIPHNR